MAKKLINDERCPGTRGRLLSSPWRCSRYMLWTSCRRFKTLIETNAAGTAVSLAPCASDTSQTCALLILPALSWTSGIRFTASFHRTDGDRRRISSSRSDWFQGTGFNEWVGTWWAAMPAAPSASLGFMIFGCGCEIGGPTVSKPSPRFKGKEMAWLGLRCYRPSRRLRRDVDCPPHRQ